MITEYIRYAVVTYEPEQLMGSVSRRGRASSLILRIEWESVAAHMEGFGQGPLSRESLRKIRPFIEEIAAMRHYHSTDVCWPRWTNSRAEVRHPAIFSGMNSLGFTAVCASGIR